ncbi:5512_t:CDS:2 [Paraglomus occultum]|uniref:Lysophospholipase n=1 Tax=Paraglomus occultum TaxID=144539 RepID=A0A9N9AA16_9GLOM|nr:5512_t:CDS:2 [Paraglomus occultum]
MKTNEEERKSEKESQEDNRNVENDQRNVETDRGHLSSQFQSTEPSRSASTQVEKTTTTTINLPYSSYLLNVAQTAVIDTNTSSRVTRTYTFVLSDGNIKTFSVSTPPLPTLETTQLTEKFEEWKQKLYASDSTSDKRVVVSEKEEKPSFFASLPKIPVDIGFESLNEKLDDIWKKVKTIPVPSIDGVQETVTRVYKEIKFEEGSIADEIRKNAQNCSLHPELEWDARVRLGDSLSSNEIEFIKRRKARIKKAFAQFIQVDENEIHEDDLPIIGIASSGGGYRAMISTAGYMARAKESGVLDCTMFFAGKRLWQLLGFSGMQVIKTFFIASYYVYVLYKVFSLKYLLFFFQDFTLARCSLPNLLTHLKSRLNVHPLHIPSFADVIFHKCAREIILAGLIIKHIDGSPMNLVDVFGTFLSSRLLIPEDVERVNERWYKLSEQKKMVEDGSAPLPIYTVVRHEIKEETEEGNKDRPEGGENEKEKVKLNYEEEKKVTNTEVNRKGDSDDDNTEDEFQWFEFTPYEIGCEDIGAWIPTWAFGRRFEGGVNVERKPEHNLGLLIGVFGSAFCATLAHYYNEIRACLPGGFLTDTLDKMVKEYEKNISTIHPISPACFPNFVYKMTELPPAVSSIAEKKNICLMDSGVDNNIPFYPLLRKGRDVDVIIAIDSSNDLQTHPYFERAAGYAKKHGITGWPVGCGWPKSPEQRNTTESAVESSFDNNDTAQESSSLTHDIDSALKSDCPTETSSSPSPNGLGPCTVFVGSESSSPPPSNRPITIIYFPLIPNPKVGDGFDPSVEEFCSTWNFAYEAKQVELLAELGKQNFREGEEEIRKVFRRVWERKRDERLKRGQ